jgi:hypothetical protein
MIAGSAESKLIHAAVVLALALPMARDASAQAASCQAEIAKQCAQTAPGRSRIAGCLRQSLDQLSSRCRAHVQAVTLQLKETRQPCEDELLLFCEGADLTEAGIAGCLRRNSAALSPECRRLADLLQKTR